MVNRYYQIHLFNGDPEAEGRQADFSSSGGFTTKWGGYHSISVLADNDITRIDRVTELNVHQCLTHLVYLTDLNETYLYTEEDFCLFKDFPHSKLVVPKINTKPNLECTCTLLYLLKYKFKVKIFFGFLTFLIDNALKKTNFR